MELAKRFDKVYAFEPVPENFRLLSENTPDNVHLYFAALSDYYGMTSMTNPAPSNSGAWEMGKRWRPGTTPPDGPVAAVRRLDEFRYLKPDFIKIDAQGSELAIIEGGTKLLTECKPVVIIETEMNGHRDMRIHAVMKGLGAIPIIEMGKETIFVWVDTLTDKVKDFFRNNGGATMRRLPDDLDQP